MLASRPSGNSLIQNDARTAGRSSNKTESLPELGRTLVTGASGFLGSATRAGLEAAGVDVIATSRPSSLQIERGAIALDATSIEAVTACIEEHKPTHFLMLAWPTDVGTRDHAVFAPWLEKIVPVMRAFAANGGHRFVGVGTCMEYDWSAPGPLSEDTPLRPGTEYGRSKAAAYQQVAAEAAALDISWGWARPFFLYGPREPLRRLVPDVITSLLCGQEVRCTEGLQHRDFLHVDDVGAALAAFTTSEVQGPLNIGSGRTIRIRDLVQIFADRLERPDLVRFGARPLQGYEAPVVVADTTKLRESLGFEEVVPQDLGVEETIDWWRQELGQTVRL